MMIKQNAKTATVVYFKQHLEQWHMLDTERNGTYTLRMVKVKEKPR